MEEKVEEKEEEKKEEKEEEEKTEENEEEKAEENAEEKEKENKEGEDSDKSSKPQKKHPKKKIKKKTLLGDILKDQLVISHRGTKFTQTNWNWRKMALRWRHAKIMLASFFTEADLFAEDPIAKLGRERFAQFRDKFPELCSELTHEQVIALSNCLGSADESLFDSDTMDLGAILQKLMDCKLDAAIIGKFTELIKKLSEPPPKPATEDDTELPAPDDEEMQKIKDIVQKKYELISRISYCGENEKCVDTNDLVFDPFDPDLRFTKKHSVPATDYDYVTHDQRRSEKNDPDQAGSMSKRRHKMRLSDH